MSDRQAPGSTPQSDGRQVSYSPAGATVREFMRSAAFVRGIMGPIGSGKSTACVIEILRKAQMQKPSPDGIRRTRWAIIRNSYPELKSTTMKTWGEWCPLAYGRLVQDSPITHHVKAGDLDMEVLFLALDRDDDVRKLLSLELTGAWVNEAREVPKPIIDALTGRVGRYPAKKDGGATWSGILMDTNPPDDQSWWYDYAEKETPHGWSFFEQPPGDSPEGENLGNLPDGYYDRIKAGKDEDWIKVYVKGQYGYVTEGKPVFPMYRDSVHVSPEVLLPAEGVALQVGADFGLTPAAVIGQRMADGRWHLLDEVVTEDCGVIRFAETVGRYVAERYPDHAQAVLEHFEDIAAGAEHLIPREPPHLREERKRQMWANHDKFLPIGWGDPAGNQRAQTDERTALEIMNEYTGWRWKPAPSNDFTMRREVVIGALNRLIDGRPGLLISPNCAMIRKGLSGGYHFRAFRTGNGTQFHDSPAKNKYSHPADALQYLLLGGGEHHVVMNRQRRKSGGNRPRIARDVDYDLFGGGVDFE